MTFSLPVNLLRAMNLGVVVADSVLGLGLRDCHRLNHSVLRNGGGIIGPDIYRSVIRRSGDGLSLRRTIPPVLFRITSHDD